VPIGEICDLINGRAFKPEDWERDVSGGLPIIRIQNLNAPDSEFNYYTGEVSDRHIVNPGELLFSWSGSRGTSFGAHIWNGGKAVLNQHIFKVGFDEARATKVYLLLALNRAVAEVEENLHGGVGLVHITKGDLEKIKIPLPPLEVQKEIVAEIEGYQKVIDGARAVVENYRPHIPIDPDWPMVEIGAMSTIVRGSSPRPQGDPKLFGGPVPRLMVADITRDGMYATPRIDSLTEEGATKSRPMKKGDVIITVSGNPGLPTILAIDACIHDGFVGLRDLSNRVLPEYLYFALLALHASHSSQSVGAVFKNLTTDQIREFTVALPPLAMQQAIVAEIEAEQALVDANRELIARFERKIRAVLARVWGEATDQNG
jgi:restriction endonuclease S subunit